jgi:hypothetical protein
LCRTLSTVPAETLASAAISLILIGFFIIGDLLT